MATKYCDHGAYGAYAAIPTWGAAQDGDGTAIGVGTPSTAEIVFTGIASTGVISVLGQAITFTRVTDANTCANNLATAINASTAVATGPASFTTLSQVRNHLYARGPANGAPAGTCQIMTRQASASHAGLIAVTHTLNNVSSAATVTFVGGTGGCLGHFINVATIWASAVAISGYGLISAVLPYTSSVGPGDVVHIRSGKTILYTNNTSFSVTTAAMGSVDLPVTYLVDDSTIWADGVDPVLTISVTATGNTRYDHNSPTTTYLNICGVQYASGQRNFVWSLPSSNADGTEILALKASGAVRYKNIDFLGKARVNLGLAGDSTRKLTLENCRLVWEKEYGIGYVGNNNGTSISLIGCEFVQLAPTAAQTTAIVGVGGSASGNILLSGCKFTGFVSGSQLSYLRIAENFSLVFNGCDFGNVTSRTSSLSTLAATGSRSFSYVSGSSVDGDFFFETTQGFSEWQASKGYPTLNARLADSLTGWSIYASPSNQSSNLSSTNPFLLPPIIKVNTLAAGTRTMTVELLVESTLAWTKDEVSAVVGYMSTSGLRSAGSFNGAGQALEVSSAAWSSTSFNGQTWLKRKFSFVLTDLQAGSEVSVQIQLHKAVANNTLAVILDPEIVLV